MSEEPNSYDSENEEMNDDPKGLDKDIVISGIKNTNQFELGNGNLHFLPANIEYTGHTNVDVYFDPLIKKNKNGKYETSFRGKYLVGNKVELDGKIIFFKGEKNGKNCIEVNEVHTFNNFFAWKFDEEFPHNSNTLKLNDIMKELEVLK